MEMMISVPSEFLYATLTCTFFPAQHGLISKRGVMVAMVIPSRSSFKVYLLHKSTFKGRIVLRHLQQWLQLQRTSLSTSYSYEWPILLDDGGFIQMPDHFQLTQCRTILVVQLQNFSIVLGIGRDFHQAIKSATPQAESCWFITPSVGVDSSQSSAQLDKIFLRKS